MTVEIPVLNRTAVALAADSASTALQATGLPKTFNTADKLFHLGRHYPNRHYGVREREEQTRERLMRRIDPVNHGYDGPPPRTL